jgi:putative restriction endonuclease
LTAMSQFWWVNHKQTWRQEIEGQYLWSPKTNSNGARNEFYNNMRRASPSDLVLSYADAQIQYAGRVAEFAFSSPKPEEFGTVGSYWSQDGWLLPVYWTKLVPPVRPKALMERLRPLFPARYSPINPQTGGGNQAAYLAEISQTLFETILSNAVFDLALLAKGGSNSLSYQIVVETVEDTIERHIATDLQLADTVRKSVIAARRGQGLFRSNVERLEKACRLTRITNPSLLKASHIKPWRACETAQERLDGMNGLLLTPDADHLFDRGFISFHDEGEVLVSSRVDREDLRRLGFDQLVLEATGFAEAPVDWRTDSFRLEQRRYLDYHRREVFLS